VEEDFVVSLRQRVGALAYDWPRFLRHISGDWKRIRNRFETITSDGRGIRCHWEYGSDVHITKVYPSASRWLLGRALADWPITLRQAPIAISTQPFLSFLIGHRGVDRLPQLLATLSSIAAQTDVAFECIVVEQSVQPEIAAQLPPWVRYVHAPVHSGHEYCRAATFNDAAAVARGEVLVLHDNDLVVPARYGAEIAARVKEGVSFMDLKRFIFYMNEEDTRPVLAGGSLRTDIATTVVQNLRGGSIAATRQAFFEVGGFDEGFVGWGGEDLEFWERARERGGTYEFGYLPLVHLWHAPQKGRAQADAPAVRRYYEMRKIPAAERIRRLLGQRPPLS
jgi:GT2 family glycosyltransferase